MAKEAWIDKREGERIHIGLNEYEGKEYIDIRQFYEANEDDWRPTKKGVTLPPDKLGELVAALKQLQETDGQ